jgi:hypothetical protein
LCNEASGGVGECCCTGTLSAEDEIRMLEAMKGMKKIQLEAMDRKIEELRRTVKE